MGLGVNGLGLGHFPDPGVTKGLNIGGAVFSNILMTLLICSRCCSINEILIFCRQKKKRKEILFFYEYFVTNDCSGLGKTWREGSRA